MVILPDPNDDGINAEFPMLAPQVASCVQNGVRFMDLEAWEYILRYIDSGVEESWALPIWFNTIYHVGVAGRTGVQRIKSIVWLPVRCEVHSVGVTFVIPDNKSIQVPGLEATKHPIELAFYEHDEFKQLARDLDRLNKLPGELLMSIADVFMADGELESLTGQHERLNYLVEKYWARYFAGLDFPDSAVMQALKGNNKNVAAKTGRKAVI